MGEQYNLPEFGWHFYNYEWDRHRDPVRQYTMARP